MKQSKHTLTEVVAGVGQVRGQLDFVDRYDPVWLVLLEHVQCHVLGVMYSGAWHVQKFIITLMVRHWGVWHGI